MAAENPSGFIATYYRKDYGVGYVIIANLIASFVTFLLLSKEFLSFRFKFNAAVWRVMIIYSLPLMIAGFGGMINETFDRIMLGWWAPVQTVNDAKVQVAIYSGCYKLSILITLFIQAFRMGAEPFFFKQSESLSPQRTYARVMKFFVITISVMFLVVALYLDVWKYFLRNKLYWTGLKVVPILLLANMFLGIYYNLSIWYKLKHKTISGAYITLIGAGDYACHQLLFYSFFWLYGLCVGYIFLLWQYDGDFIPVGSKGISYTICLEKTLLHTL